MTSPSRPPATDIVNTRDADGSTSTPATATFVNQDGTTTTLNTGAIGGNAFAIGTLSTRLPSLLPESYGVSIAAFSDFGTLGRVDNVIRTCGGVNVGGTIAQSCVKDNFAFRASAGLSFGWRSPFGPLQIDLGIPIVKASYDRPQIIHFSAGTGF